MRQNRRKLLGALLLCLTVPCLASDPLLSGAVDRREAIERLGVLGSALMIGAHPDDENNATLAWFARGRLWRTAYLSLTRGEGGQNLVGPEQGALLGIIRTQELLAARRIDGAEQYFTRAIDFGFSKSAEEAMAKWGHNEVLADAVWVIRRFRPDIVVLIFSGTGRDGHGHHQAAGIIGREAVAAAADPDRFPEQLKYVEPWKVRRVVWNAWGGSGQADYRIDTGAWNPVIGYSYGELAGMSRSLHRSQGMGGPPRRGEMAAQLAHIAGERGKSITDGIDASWSRVAGGAEAGRILADALRSLDDAHPERAIPALLAARKVVAGLKDPWAGFKLRELDEAVADCAGLWVDAASARWDAVPGADLRITTSVLKRAPVEAALRGVSAGAAGESAQAEPLPDNRTVTREFTWRVPADADPSQPYWLREPPRGELYTVANRGLVGLAETPPLLEARFRIGFGADEIELRRPVIYRYVDRSQGELTRPLEVVPAVAVQWADTAIVFPSEKPKKVRVVLRANMDCSGELRLETAAGWKVTPPARSFEGARSGQQVPLEFTVTPPPGAQKAKLRAVVRTGAREFSSGMEVISYPHFPAQTVFPAAVTELVRADVKVLAQRVGYVMGAGDEVPGSLAQLGLQVELLGPDDLAKGDLSRFDAIVTGVRAYNTRPDLRASQARLLDYVEKGGTLVVQYNVADGRTDSSQLAALGPYPFRVGRERVAVEEAPVELTDPANALLRDPNRISARDFEGWVQERGLYFANEWDPRYKTLFESHDPGEPPRAGGTIYTRYGKGAYVFTAYSWFRQLPAGVPGAYRIFSNLLSAGKVLAGAGQRAAAK